MGTIQTFTISPQPSRAEKRACRASYSLAFFEPAAMPPRGKKVESSPAPEARRNGKGPAQFAAKPEDFEEDTPLAQINERKKGARKEGKDTLEEFVRKQVQKCLKDNFGTLSDAEKYKVRDGEDTLFSTLFADKMKAYKGLPDAPKFGRTYFAEMRKRFAKADLLATLEVPEEEQIDPVLFEAVDLSRGKPPKREQLLLFCRTSSHLVNQSECVGLIQHAFEMVPTPINYLLNIEMIRYLHRVRADTRFPKEFKVYLSHIDRVLAFGYAHLRTKGVTLEAFFEQNKGMIGLVLPIASVQKLLSAKGSWQGLEDDIEAITGYATSQLGDKMFAFARSASTDARVAKLIQSGLQTAFHEADLTLQGVAGLRAALHSQMQAAFRQDDLSRPRVAQIPYIGGMVVKLEVPLVFEEGIVTYHRKG